MNFNRSRWAAFGAATAVIAGAGAGGIGFAQAAGNSSPSSFVSTVPCRVLDTRTDAIVGGLGAAAVFTLDARSALVDCGIPADATGLSVNIAAVGATSNTFLTAYPHGTARPGASHVNVTKGVVTSNGVDVALSDDGKLDIYNQSGDVNVIIDVLGAYVPAASGTGTAGAQGPQGDAGVQGPKGAQGEQGEQGPAGEDAAGFRMVPVELELDLDEDDGDYAYYDWSGPLDVCDGGTMVEVRSEPTEGVQDAGAFLFNIDGGGDFDWFGPPNGGLFGSDSVNAWAEFYEELPTEPWADTTLLNATVVCGPALILDGEFDGVADNDVNSRYDDGGPR